MVNSFDLATLTTPSFFGYEVTTPSSDHELLFGTTTRFAFSSVRVELLESEPEFNAKALFILPLLCLIGLIGNFMVCLAIATDRRLHNVTNYFLFSLAVADLLVCCVVMPLSIVVEVRHGVWTWSVKMCLLYVYSDVFLCSASIVHMSVISLDRFLGISHPLHTRNKSKSMIFFKIAMVWILTMLVSCPIAVLAINDPTNILQDNQCQIFSRQYIVYGSTMTFVIPFCIMAVTYFKTTNLLRRQANILSEQANGKNNGNGLRRSMPHRKLGYVKTTSSSSALSGFKASTASGRTTYATCYATGEIVEVSRDSANGQMLVKGKRSAIKRWKSRTSNYISSIAHRVGRRNSLQAASQELANEHKATRVLAVVFVCFFICWTPFFAANLLTGFCGSRCQVPPWLGSVFLWLGYMSSTINPIIYTVFNKRFREAFIKILRCQCFHKSRDNLNFYSRNYTTTVVPDNYTWSNYDRIAGRNTTVLGEEGPRHPPLTTRMTSVAHTSFTERDTTRDSVVPKKSSLPNLAKLSSTIEENSIEEQQPLLEQSSEQDSRILMSCTVLTSQNEEGEFDMSVTSAGTSTNNDSMITASSSSFPPLSSTAARPLRLFSLGSRGGCTSGTTTDMSIRETFL